MGSAAYMPCQHRYAYKSNTHTIRRNFKTKYNDNKKQRSVFGMYTKVDFTIETVALRTYYTIRDGIFIYVRSIDDRRPA